MGDRDLVGDPEPVAGCLVLCADGELSGGRRRSSNTGRTSNIIPRQRIADAG